MNSPARPVGGVAVGIEDVSVQYQTPSGTVDALIAMSTHIDVGEFVSLVGPSGCGKSTLLNVVAGLLPATTGRVTIAGEPVTSPHPELGIVFQEPVLLDWRTILDNVLLQADVRRLDRKTYTERAQELLSRVGLAGFEQKRPYELSGGMRQRAAICRALLHDPALLLMDEPFGALDAFTREQMNEDLQRLWMDLRPSVVFVTHSIPEAVLLSDRVVVMSRRPGRLLGSFAIKLPRPRKARELAKQHEYLDYIERIRTTLDEGADHPSGVDS